MSAKKSGEDAFNPTVSEEDVVLAGEYSEQDQRLADSHDARRADAWRHGLHALATLPDLTPSAQTIEAFGRVNANNKMNATIDTANWVNDAFDTVRTRGGNIQKTFEEPQKLDPEHFRGSWVVTVNRGDGTYAEYNEREGAFFLYTIDENSHQKNAFDRESGEGIISADSKEGQELLAIVKQQQEKQSGKQYAEAVEQQQDRKFYHDKVELPEAVQAAKDILSLEGVKKPAMFKGKELNDEIARLKRNSEEVEEQKAA